MLWSIAAGILVVICVGVYFAFVKQPPQVNAATEVSPQRLQDPDPHSREAAGWDRK